MNSSVETILETIKSSKGYVNISGITLNDLLTTDSNGITYLEHAIKNEIYLHDLYKDILNNADALTICVNNSFTKVLYGCKNDDAFFNTNENGEMIIDLIFEKFSHFDIGCYVISAFSKHFEILDYMQKNNCDRYYSLSRDFCYNLCTTDEGNKYLKKYRDKIASTIVNRVEPDVLLNYALKNNDLDILKNVKENFLLTEVNGKTVLEVLLEAGIDPTFYGYDFEDKKCLDLLIKYNRLDLLYNSSANLLVEELYDGKTAIDLLFEAEKQNNSNNLERFVLNRYSNSSPYDIARLLIAFAKHDGLGYTPDFKADKLLEIDEKSNKSILDCLMELDKNYATEKVLSPVVIKDPKVAFVLRKYGINDTLINVEDEVKDYSVVITEEYNKEYAKDVTSVYEEEIKTLEDLFLNDGKSSKEVIDILGKAYRGITINENPMILLEIKQLIAIKKANYDKFIYKNGKGGSKFFSAGADEGSVLITDYSISTLRHETSHALHHYLTDYYKPDDYMDIIKRVREIPGVVEKVSSLNKKLIELFNSERESVDEDAINNHYDKQYADDSYDKLVSFLSSHELEQREALKGRYPDDVIDVIISSVYSPEQIISNKKELEKKRVAWANMHIKSSSLLFMNDIVDAVFEGKLYNGVMLDDLGARIIGVSGHGIDYYHSGKKGFTEMIAEYGAIVKSEDGKEVIELLRSIVGDELVDVIKDVYENKILKSQRFINDPNELEVNNYVR